MPNQDLKERTAADDDDDDKTVEEETRPVLLTAEERYQVWTVKAAERPFLLEKYSTDNINGINDNGTVAEDPPPLTDGCDIPSWRQHSMISGNNNHVELEAVLRIGSGSSLMRRERQWPMLSTATIQSSKWKRIQQLLLQDPLPEPTTTTTSLSSSPSSSSSLSTSVLQRLSPIYMDYSEIQALYPHGNKRRGGDPAPIFEQISIPAMIRGVTTTNSSSFVPTTPTTTSSSSSQQQEQSHWNMPQLSWKALCQRYGDYEWRFSDTHGESMTLHTYQRYCDTLEGLLDDAPLAVYDSQFHTDERRDILNDFQVPACFTYDLFDYLPEEGEYQEQQFDKIDGDDDGISSVLDGSDIEQFSDEEAKNVGYDYDDSTDNNSHHKVEVAGVKPPYRWILMGPERSGTGIHIDPIGTHAWLTLTEGCKRWILFHPDTPPSDIGYLTKTDTGQQVPSVVWFEEWWIHGKLANQPHLEKPIQYVTFLQKPGDTVYVPAGWPHLVLNLERSVAITQNYATEFPSLDHFWKGVEMDSTPEQQTALRRALEQHRPDLQLPTNDQTTENEIDDTIPASSSSAEKPLLPLQMENHETDDSSDDRACISEAISENRSEPESTEMLLARPLWWLYCLHGGFSLALPTTALMYMLNTHVELPVSLLPSYGALAFCPFSLKPLYAYWAVRKGGKRHFQLTALLVLNAVFWTITACVPPHAVLLFLVISFARGVTTAWPELLLGLALVEQARQHTTCSTAAAHLQTQAATARNVGSLSAHGIVVAFWLSWISFKHFPNKNGKDDTEPLLNQQTAACLFAMTSISSLVAAFLAWKYRVGSESRHEIPPVNPETNAHSDRCEVNDSETCIQTQPPISYNSMEPFMDPLLEDDNDVHDQGLVDEDPSESSEVQEIASTPILTQEAILVVTLQVAVILLILYNPLKQDMPIAGPWIWYTSWVLCFLVVGASFFVGKSQYTALPTRDTPTSNSASSSKSLYRIGLFLILRQVVPDASFLTDSFRYQVFAASPLMLQLLSMGEMVVLAAASWSFGRVLSPWCAFPVGQKRNQDRPSTHTSAVPTFYWVLAGTAVLAAVASFSHLWFIRVAETSQSGTLRGVVAVFVGTFTTWTSEWSFLPKVILATASVEQGQPGGPARENTTQTNDATNDSSNQQHRISQNSSDLQKQREVQYGSLITCIDFGDQLGALVASGVVAWMDISRENHWEGLQEYVCLCAVGEVLSLVWMVMLLWK